jgi:transposase
VTGTRTAGAKTDPADAELLARILLTDRERHRALGPRSPQVEAIRVLARDDERASRDQRRLLNRLRQDLLEVLELPRCRGQIVATRRSSAVGTSGARTGRG